MSDYGPLPYVAQQSNGQFSVLDANDDAAPYGFAVPKGSELAPATRGRGQEMIVVTHEFGFAREVADQVAFLDDGVILEQGPPEQELDRATQERTRAFLARVV